MKIKTFGALQAARAELTSITALASKNLTITPEFTANQKARIKLLNDAITAAEPIESKLKETHLFVKANEAEIKSNPAAFVKKQLDKFLRQKSVVINSGDGSNLGIAEMVSGTIAARTRLSNGLLSQINIDPLASVKSLVLRELTSAQIARYAETDGTIGFTNADTVSGKILKNYLVLSELYHKLPVTDEAMNDTPDLVAFTLEQLQKQYEEQYATELILGETGSAELPGVFTDLLDSANGYAEALKADDIRDVNTFGAMATSVVNSLGTKPLEVFNAFVASLPASHRKDAVVTMHPDTVKAYQKVTDSNGRALFNIKPTFFENYPLSLDDNYPVLGDVDKAIVTFGDADTALSMGNVDIKLQDNPFQRDGVTLFKHIGRVGLAVANNNALRVLLAGDLAPVFTSESSISIAAASANGTVAYTAVAKPVDPTATTVAYTLVDPQGIFAIDSVTGVLTVSDNTNLTVPNSGYEATITATDDSSDANTADLKVTVNITA